MTIINVNLSNAAANPALPANWNHSNVNPTTNQQIFADLIDNTGASTGISLHITSPFGGGSSSLSWADGDYHGLPRAYWCSAWYGTSGTLQLQGFNPGQSGTLVIAGHANNTRDTRFRLNGGTGTVYDGVVGPSPTSPLSLAFTADGSGNLSILCEVISVFGYVNGFSIDYAPTSSVTITDIDDVYSGQSGTLTISDVDYVATSLDLSDGAITKNISLTGSGGNFTFTGPSVTDGGSLLRTGNVSAVATDGVTPTAGTTTTFTIRSGHPDDASLRDFSSVTLTDVSDPDTIGLAFTLDPLPEIGWDIIYDATRGWLVDSFGILTNSTTFTGTSRFYLRDLSGICTFLDITTVNGTPTGDITFGRSLAIGYGIGIGI